jgi:hypothetical protein
LFSALAISQSRALFREKCGVGERRMAAFRMTEPNVI